jgi:hypothetical protein
LRKDSTIVFPSSSSSSPYAGGEILCLNINKQLQQFQPHRRPTSWWMVVSGKHFLNSTVCANANVSAKHSACVYGLLCCYAITENCFGKVGTKLFCHCFVLWHNTHVWSRLNANAWMTSVIFKDWLVKWDL